MRGAIVFVCAGIACPTAAAGPWGQASGDSFARAALSREQIDGASAWRADVYGEYGVSKNWTLIGKAESVRFPDARDFDASEARLLIQRRIYERRNIVVASGVGAVYGAAIGGIDTCNSVGIESRASIGTSGTLATSDWYVSADLSARWHDDGCERRKLDFVFGIEQSESVTFSPQLYIEQSNRGADSAAVQLEWIRHFSVVDVTFAYKYESGEQFEQHASIIAVSKRF